MKRVLVFGDSNSWGHVPAKCTRYPEDSRWPAVAAALLGPEYQIIEDSISGRTTVYEDPVVPFRCGKDNLGYSMLAHAPLDLVVLALGGNDLKFTDADGVILNAGAYTHTSLAIADAIAGIQTPVIEVHISNTASREAIRHKSLIAPVCCGTITGFGLNSYFLAAQAFVMGHVK